MKKNVVIAAGAVLVLVAVFAGFSKGKKSQEVVYQDGDFKIVIEDAPEFNNIPEAQAKETPQTVVARPSEQSASFDEVVRAGGQAHAVTHTVKAGDTLGHIARKYKTTVDLIKKRNGLKNDIIRIGQELSIWVKPLEIEVSKTAMQLRLKLEDKTIKTYPISIGKAETATPIGEYMITSKLVNPVWYHEGKEIQPDDPENALGTRWLGFDDQGYGIHGTIEPDQIGQPASRGCVRMYNKDVEEVFSLVTVGTKLVILEE